MKVLIVLFLIGASSLSFASEETELVCLGSEGEVYEVIIGDDEEAGGIDKQVHSFSLDNEEEIPVVPQMAVVIHKGNLYVLTEDEFAFIADETLRNGFFTDLKNGLDLECSINDTVEPS